MAVPSAARMEASVRRDADWSPCRPHLNCDRSNPLMGTPEETRRLTTSAPRRPKGRSSAPGLASREPLVTALAARVFSACAQRRRVVQGAEFWAVPAPARAEVPLPRSAAAAARALLSLQRSCQSGGTCEQGVVRGNQAVRCRPTPARRSSSLHPSAPRTPGRAAASA
jgi:hypothetical protein